jgi:hypothetical protein
MLQVPVGVLTLLLAAPALWAWDDPKPQKNADKPPPEKAQTPAEEFKAIQADFLKEQREFSAAYSKATPQERQKLQYPEPQKYAKRMMALAEKNPKDAAAGDALAWVVKMRADPEAKKALELLLRDHLDSKQLGDVCQSLRYSSSPDTEKNLRSILAKSPHHEVQGQACLAVAQYLKGQGQRAKSPTDATKKQTKEAEDLLERVAKDFADIALYSTRSDSPKLGTVAKGELFEMRDLVIGKVVPEITGEDIDGHAFKLSEYRGKVVLLDFWGNW